MISAASWGLRSTFNRWSSETWARRAEPVAFTRDPSTGENHFYGEYLMNAQGEDVVAGIRTPEPIETLERVNPEAYRHG